MPISHGVDIREWLAPGELRVGLGCMRLPFGDDRDESRALETIAAAAAAGITVFDTARSYVTTSGCSPAPSSPAGSRGGRGS